MIIKSNSDIQVVLDWIEKQTVIAYDTETTGLNTRKDEIIGFSISNAEEGFYVAHQVYHPDTGLTKLVDKYHCIKILKALLSKKLLMFNGSFDSRFTLNYFGVNLISDLYCEVMLLKHTCDEEQPFRLKDIAKKLFGDDAAEEQKLMKQSIKDNGGSVNEYYKADLELMGKYAIKDTLLTYQIFEHYSKDLKSQGLESFFYRDEVMPLYKEVIIPMELRGLRIDVPMLENLHKELKEDISKLQIEILNDISPLLDEFEKWFLWKNYPPRRTGLFAQAIAEYANLNLPLTETGKYSMTKKNVEALESSMFREFLLGGEYLEEETVLEIQRMMYRHFSAEHMFNLSSKHHLKKLFFDKLKERPISTTEHGSPQVDDEFLDLMAQKYDWAEKLRTYNKLIKLEGTYIGRYLEQQEDNYFFPSWFMHRTTSGRLGGDMMQMPRQMEEGNELVKKYNNSIRNCIIGGNGRKLVGADYSSLEVVVFADDAGDESLLDMIRNKEDFYSKTAIKVFNLQDQYSADKKADNFLKNHKPELRQDAKIYSLGIRYGMQPFKLSKTLNITEHKANDIIKSYFRSYPKLKSRMDDLIAFAKKNGQVKSKGGRIRHLGLLKSLQYAHGDDLGNSLKIWEKWNHSPQKYKQMKYLGKQYRNMINNCLNFPIQSMAATITNRACIAIMREFRRVKLDAWICLQIHDEIVVNCADKDVERVKKIVRFLMENTTKLSVPLNAEPESGDKYGDIK